MPYDPDQHHRRTIRLRDYDYTQNGAYFVTICTHNRECLFGMIYDGDMWLNKMGNVVVDCWRAIPEHFPYVELDAFVVMPNHVHGILFILKDDTPTQRDLVGTQHAASLPNVSPSKTFAKVAPGSLSAIVRSFKSAVTKRLNEMNDTPGVPIWQGRFYDHIIRDADDLNTRRAYTETNPARCSESTSTNTHPWG